MTTLHSLCSTHWDFIYNVNKFHLPKSHNKFSTHFNALQSTHTGQHLHCTTTLKALWQHKARKLGQTSGMYWKVAQHVTWNQEVQHCVLDTHQMMDSVQLREGITNAQCHKIVRKTSMVEDTVSHPRTTHPMTQCHSPELHTQWHCVTSQNYTSNDSVPQPRTLIFSNTVVRSWNLTE